VVEKAPEVKQLSKKELKRLEDEAFERELVRALACCVLCVERERERGVGVRSGVRGEIVLLARV
jgi:hypothetical protein